ncbi:hypothetical protein BHE74_00010041 [Ensete ventricosum]|uniref:Uncharacterized protein n=1 Tax=Ensete ventricosum TaxID=4639 RepID=A0A444G6C6_ENSVE|nr:hypothetical protein GW17_00005001 [Ensete ventricosum]RWW81539.1 hypothetical protein BHE74_00010041 [Ensete ventricosum]RZR75384.1 hypothetical protein BHM03_00056084 [Ensete ventricosum]
MPMGTKMTPTSVKTEITYTIQHQIALPGFFSTTSIWPYACKAVKKIKVTHFGVRIGLQAGSSCCNRWNYSSQHTRNRAAGGKGGVLRSKTGSNERRRIDTEPLRFFRFSQQVA